MKYKIISTDFDGTLLTTDKKITKKTKNILINCKKNNFLLVGITARNLTSLKNVCDINLFDYLILNNGTFLYDVKNKNGNNIKYLNKITVIELTNYFNDISSGFYYFSPKNCYFLSSTMKPYHYYFNKINNVNEISEPISSMNIFFEKEKILKKYNNLINTNFIDVSSIVMEDSDKNPKIKWISINPKNITKLSTLKILCSNLKLSLNEVIFFGDAINDIDVIKNVGLGVAVSNALPEVKKIAKKITLSNDEDGVSIFLKEFLK